MIIRGNQRQSRKWRVGSHLMKEAINDHQRQSEAIRGNHESGVWART